MSHNMEQLERSQVCEPLYQAILKGLNKAHLNPGQAAGKGP